MLILEGKVSQTYFAIYILTFNFLRSVIARRPKADAAISLCHSERSRGIYSITCLQAFLILAFFFPINLFANPLIH